MKRMFSKKGLVESSKEDSTQDIDSDADLQEWVVPSFYSILTLYRITPPPQKALELPKDWINDSTNNPNAAKTDSKVPCLSHSFNT